MSNTPGTSDNDLEQFAAAVAHEIRTPLTAVAGEIAVALRRERSAEEYREVLKRIAAPVAELIALSGDLTLLSDSGRPQPDTAATTTLDAVFTHIQRRYGGRADVSIETGDTSHVQVAGDETRLVRAITLVIEHAIRQRRLNARVSVRVMTGLQSGVQIVVHARPFGFWPHAWLSLEAPSVGPADPLRLRTARRILEDSGGSVVRGRGSDTDAVHINLQTAG